MKNMTIEIREDFYGEKTAFIGYNNQKFEATHSNQFFAMKKIDWEINKGKDRQVVSDTVLQFNNLKFYNPWTSKEFKLSEEDEVVLKLVIIEVYAVMFNHSHQNEDYMERMKGLGDANIRCWIERNAEIIPFKN